MDASTMKEHLLRVTPVARDVFPRMMFGGEIVAAFGKFGQMQQIDADHVELRTKGGKLLGLYHFAGITVERVCGELVLTEGLLTQAA